MLPEADINPPVKMLPPVMLPATLILPPPTLPVILPIKLAAVMLPAAETCPAVAMLPPVMFPLTLAAVNIPTLVILGCALV